MADFKVHHYGSSRGKSHSAASSWLRALERTALIAQDPSIIFPTAFEQLAERFGDMPALLSDTELLTYRGLEELSNRYSRWALKTGLNKGECICLFMPNRPEYMAIWLGITRIGGVVSLLNTKLTGHALAHCIELVAPRYVIVDSQLTLAFLTAHPRLSTDTEIWIHGENSTDFPRIDIELTNYSGEGLTGSERPPLTIEDRALFIYTSGTTGHPKAASVSHHRLMVWSHWFAGMMDTRASDRMYNTLPMYHSIGGVVAIGSVFVNGGSVVIRDKFSVSEFWNEVVRWDCSLFQYIGELCRYLVTAPFRPEETRHKLRLCCGNGLRDDIWNLFKDRFRIPQILEFYAATEGNVSMFNIEGKPGSIGRIPLFLSHRFPAALVRFDTEREQPVRDELGFCIRCAPNETGEAIGKIVNGRANVGARFEGYSCREETERKILRHVFEPDDAWFRTGDLMRKDEQGYFYFVDRIGDTFRWKGENVATSEVSDIIVSFPGIKEASVYGVSLPEHDGRACMAAIVVDGSFELAAFRDYLGKSLPAYAQPLFLRLCSKIETTGTFKHKKGDLMKEAYNPSATTDLMYFNDLKRAEFVQVDQVLYQEIQDSHIRV